MTEITKVPLQPIAKGALTKLWLGVAAVALAAGGRRLCHAARLSRCRNDQARHRRFAQG